MTNKEKLQAFQVLDDFLSENDEEFDKKILNFQLISYRCQ